MKKVKSNNLKHEKAEMKAIEKLENMHKGMKGIKPKKKK
jgi:hypothetical protein